MTEPDPHAGSTALATQVPVVVAASAPWDSPAPVNSHHVARRLAAAGHRVLFVESTGLRAPSLAARHDLGRVARRLRHFAGGVREVAPHLWVHAPLALPGGGPRWLRRVSLRALGIQSARAARRQGFRAPVLWSFLPTAVGMLRSITPSLVVYHCVDHYAANPGVDRAWIESLEAEMLERADLVLVSSSVLGERLAERRGDVRVLPNVADVGLFSSAAAGSLAEHACLAGIPRPRAVYAGNLAAYRIDFALLAGLARARPDVSFVLLGPRGLGDVQGAADAEQQLLALPNLHALGSVDHAELPAVFAHCDVALIPFLENEHTRGSLPLKLWEYLAAGLPVVATALPNLEAHQEPGVIWLARDDAGFARALGEALESGPAARAERLARARVHDWARRTEELRDLAGAALMAKAGSPERGAPV